MDDDMETDSEGGHDELVERTLSSGADLGEALDAQACLLERIDEPRARRATLRLWAGADWSTRRALLARIGEPGHAELVPELAEFAPALDASGRRDVVLALARIGGVAGEPILEYLLRTSPMSVQVVAADTLAELGTRSSVQALRGVLARSRDPILIATLLNAIDKIEARHPVNANHGSLTLAEDGAAGALTLSGAASGEVTLYERSLESVSRLAVEEGERALVLSKGEGVLQRWQGLAPAPRRAPHQLVMYAVSSDHVGVIAFVLGMFSVLTYWIVSPSLAFEGVPLPLEIAGKVLTWSAAALTVLGPVLTPFVLFIRWRDRYERLRRFLTEGEYATARVLQDDRGEVEYVDASGELRSATLTERQRGRFRGGDKIPVLTDGQELLVLSRLQGVTPREDGGISLRVMSPGVVVISAISGLFLLPCFLGLVFALAASV